MQITHIILWITLTVGILGIIVSARSLAYDVKRSSDLDKITDETMADGKSASLFDRDVIKKMSQAVFFITLALDFVFLILSSLVTYQSFFKYSMSVVIIAIISLIYSILLIVIHFIKEHRRKTESSQGDDK